MHFEVAMAAIEAGKHVNCEKPLANQLDHARQMAEAAKKKGVTTIVGFNYIQNPVHVLARDSDSPRRHRRRESRPPLLRLRFHVRPEPAAHLAERSGRAGSGMIGDVGAHCLSYFYYLLDRQIEEVFCQLETVIPDHAAPLGDGAFRLDAAGDKTKRIKNTTDDIATVIFRFSDGGSGEMSLSRVATGIRYNIGYDVMGTLGTVRYSYDRINDIQLYRPTGEPAYRGFTHIEMGPSDPRFAAMHPVPAWASATTTTRRSRRARCWSPSARAGRPFRISPSATASSGSSWPARSRMRRAPGSKSTTRRSSGDKDGECFQGRRRAADPPERARPSRSRDRTSATRFVEDVSEASLKRAFADADGVVIRAMPDPDVGLRDARSGSKSFRGMASAITTSTSTI